MIKIATEQDFDGINSVIVANRSSDDIYKYPGSFGDSRDILSAKDRIIFVCVENENVIGFLSLHDTNLYEIGCEAKLEIVVHPEHRDRKKHYGERLLLHVINYSKKKTKINLLEAWVLAENVPSINLLQKCGFSGGKNANEGKGFIIKLNISR